MTWSRQAGVLGGLVVVAVVLALGGCGDDDGDRDATPPDGATAGDDDAASSSADCPLTTEQVRAVVAKEVEQVDIAISCRWEYEEEDESNATFDYANVTYTPLPAVAVTDEALDDVGARPVGGVGDQAWVVLPNALLVHADDLVFEIEVDTNADDEADIALAEELARLVIGES